MHDITPIGCCCRTCVSEYCAPYHYDCSTQWLNWVDGWIRERLRCVGCCNAHQYRNKLAYCSKAYVSLPSLQEAMAIITKCKQNVLTHHLNQTENGAHTVIWWAIPGGNTFGSRPGRYFPRAAAHLLMSSTISCSRLVSSGVRE